MSQNDPKSLLILRRCLTVAILLFPINLWAQSSASEQGGSGLYSNVPTIQRSERETIALVQTELNRLGCSLGTADGVVGARSRAALRSYLERKNGNYEYSDDLFRDAEFLVSISEETGTLCEPESVTTPSRNPTVSFVGSYRVHSGCTGLWRVYREWGDLTITRNGEHSFHVTLVGELGSNLSATLVPKPNHEGRFWGNTSFYHVSKIGFPRTVEGRLELWLSSNGEEIRGWIDPCGIRGNRAS